MSQHEQECGCGRRGAQVGAGRREPFAFPGTARRYSRDRVVDVRHTRLEVTVDPAQRSIAGVARHTATAINDGTVRVTFDAAELVIDGVTDQEGRKLAFEHVDEVLTVTLAEPAAAAAEITISIAYHGQPRRGLYFVAPDDAYPNKPVQAWTQGQDEDSRYWFPCFDYPNEKATTEVVVTAPSKYSTLSNGALVGTSAGPGKGMKTWHWRMSIPHVAYLVTLVVGEFEEVALGKDGLPMPVYVPLGRGKDVARCFGRTPKMVEHFSERFGVPYPYEKYAQVVVSDFIFGGMENTTATTLTEYALYDERAGIDYDADDLVAHELGHQWWGDLLTCRDWSHAWLNEGFATFCEAVAREALRGKDEMQLALFGMARRYFAEDGGEYRRPIVCKTYEAPIDVFDRHLYEKGGCVLHMLRGELGEESFWRSIRTYASANRGRTVVTDDLRRAIEEATGKNFEWFFDQWVFGAGHPEIKAGWTWDEQAKAAAISIKQVHRADDQTTEAFRGTMTVEVRAGGATHALRLAIKDREHTFHVPLPARPDLVRFDPEGFWLAVWNLDVGLDAHRKTLAGDPSVALRLRAATALGKDQSGETVQALARALRKDAFWGVRAEAATALGTVRTPASREALLAALGADAPPKVRRAIVAALGAFRHDEAAADALREVVEKGDESLFVEAEAAEALGRVRAEGARKLLEKVLDTRDSWADTIRAGAVRGLGHLATEDVLPALYARLEWGHHPRVRASAAMALSEIGARLVTRDGVRERLESHVDDKDFRVQMASLAALRALGDEGAIPALRKAAEQQVDGRVRRAARAAARRLEQGADRHTETARLSDAVETLRRQNAELVGRLERLETKTGLAKPVEAKAGASPKAGKTPKKATKRPRRR